VPRFFFHVRDDLDVPDYEGLDQPDLAAAQTHATHSARSLMCATLIGEGRITLGHRIDIEDSEHRCVATVTFGDAVKIEE
jgi:uncharacterized protein DUF6894